MISVKRLCAISVWQDYAIRYLYPSVRGLLVVITPNVWPFRLDTTANRKGGLLPQRVLCSIYLWNRSAQIFNYTGGSTGTRTSHVVEVHSVTLQVCLLAIIVPYSLCSHRAMLFCPDTAGGGRGGGRTGWGREGASPPNLPGFPKSPFSGSPHPVCRQNLCLCQPLSYRRVPPLEENACKRSTKCVAG